MQRVKEPKMSVLTHIFDSYQVVRSRPDTNLFPQMPLHQVSHLIKQAAHKNLIITLQMNPTPFKKEIMEVTGIIDLSPQSSQIILKSDSAKTIHLIQPRHIRHLRIA